MPERVEIRPFHALHYAADRVRLADVVSPPYDVIDEDLRRRLLERSPYNVVHLILPEPGEEREAGDTLEAWRREGRSSCASRGRACTGSSSTRAGPTACAAAARA